MSRPFGDPRDYAPEHQREHTIDTADGPGDGSRAVLLGVLLFLGLLAVNGSSQTVQIVAFSSGVAAYLGLSLGSRRSEQARPAAKPGEVSERTINGLLVLYGLALAAAVVLDLGETAGIAITVAWCAVFVTVALHARQLAQLGSSRTGTTRGDSFNTGSWQARAFVLVDTMVGTVGLLFLFSAPIGGFEGGSVAVGLALLAGSLVAALAVRVFREVRARR